MSSCQHGYKPLGPIKCGDFLPSLTVINIPCTMDVLGCFAFNNFNWNIVEYSTRNCDGSGSTSMLIKLFVTSEFVTLMML
jgi:hypothetical protein